MIDEREAAVEAFCVKLGTNLRLMRLRRLMTVEELAVKSGTSEMLLRRLERGDWQQANLRTISDVAFALQVELELRLIDTKPEEVPTDGDLEP